MKQSDSKNNTSKYQGSPEHNKKDYGKTEKQIEQEISETYKAIKIFKGIGISLLIIAGILVIVDRDEFSALIIACIFFGGALVWMTGKMKQQVKTNGLSEPNHYLLKKNGHEKSRDTDQKPVDVADEEAELKLPNHLHIQFFDEYMQISYKKSTRNAFKIMFLSVSFLGLLGYMFSKSSGQSGDEGYFLIAPLITLLYSFFLLLNATHIYVSKQAIEIKQQPIPWLNSKRLNASIIKQLFSVSDDYGYQIRIITQEGADVELLSGLETKKQIKYIEQQIEKYLGIKDIKVRNEFR